MTSVRTSFSILCCALLLAPLLVLPVTAAEAKQLGEDDELRDRLLELMDRRMKEFRQEMARQLDAVLEARGDEARLARRVAELEEENARLKRVLRELRSGEPATGENEAGAPGVAFLGVSTVPASDELAERVKVDPGSCLEVVTVLEQSPAAAVGLRTGDVITRIEGKPASRENFQGALASKKVGDSLELTYFQTSGSSPIRIDAKTQMANRQDFAEAIARLMARQQGGAAGNVGVTPAAGPVKLGMTVEEVSSGNVQVLEVSDGGNAAAAGLQSGDRVTGLGDRSVKTLDDIRAALGSWSVGQEGVFRYERGKTQYVATVRLGGGGQAPRLQSMRETQPAAPKKVTFGVSVEEPEGGRGGLSVLEVFGGSNAAEAGLQVGDRLVNVDGKRIRTLDDLRSALSEWKAGSEAKIRYRRDRTTFNATVVLAAEGQRPRLVSLEENTRGGGANTDRSDAPRRRGFLGVRLAEADNGLRIGEVIANSSAAAMGVQVGDVLTSINGNKVRRQVDLRDTLGSLSAGDAITVEVIRNGSTQTLKGTLGAPPESPQASREVIAPRVRGMAQAAAGSPTRAVAAATHGSRPTLGLVAAEDGERVVVDALLPGRSSAAASRSARRPTTQQHHPLRQMTSWPTSSPMRTR